MGHIYPDAMRGAAVILMALIFSQLVVLLALLQVTRDLREVADKKRDEWPVLSLYRRLRSKLNHKLYCIFTYDPFPVTCQDPLGRSRWMTAEEREAQGLAGPVAGKWYQRSR